MVKRIANVLAHVVIWLLLYFLPYLFSFKGQSNIRTIFSDSGDTIHLVSFIFLMGYSYLNYYFLIPRVFFKKKYVIYLLTLTVFAVIVIKVPQFFEGLSNAPHRPPPGEAVGGFGGPGHGFGGGPPIIGRGDDSRPILFGMSYNILLFFFLTFVAVSLQYRNRVFRYEKERLNAELSFLKTQINPHFLFNSLNTIYSLVIEKSDEAPGALIQLSEMMRYVIKDANEDKVRLDAELRYIDNYIGLQKQRLGGTAKVAYHNSCETGDYMIAPLILMSFIENAFKYGVNPDEDSEISIDISNNGSVARLLVSNKKVRVANTGDSTGIGLKNARSRLAYLYPAKHELTISDDGNNYSVDLKIELV